MKLETLAGLQGQKLGASRWITVGQDRIDQFAEVTEDRQFIHVDPIAAKATGFGGTIAHGFLTLSLLSAMLEDAQAQLDDVASSVNYGFDKIRFVTPVSAGADIRGNFSIVDVQTRGDGTVLVKYAVSVEIRGQERPALVAEWLGLYVPKK